MGGRLVSDLRLDQATGAVSAVVSRDREGNQTVHEADAVVFAIGITGEVPGKDYADSDHMSMYHLSQSGIVQQ